MPSAQPLCPPPAPCLRVRRLGRVEYAPTFAAMQEFTATRTAETTDELWIVEHPPVFTLGQAGKPEHLLRDIGIPLVQIDRGGQVTYHGPGQVIIYLLLDLNRRQLKVRELVRHIEQAVIDLLVAMGYGGAGGVAMVTQLVNDRGIDGVVDQDVLGLNKVYVQAKRYAAGNSVGRPELQGFVGALSGKADRGVFLTTSYFSKGAMEYADHDTSSRLILVDGKRLTELMIRFGVGVQVKDTVHVVEVDEDFFE